MAVTEAPAAQSNFIPDELKTSVSNSIYHRVSFTPYHPETAPSGVTRLADAYLELLRNDQGWTVESYRVSHVTSCNPVVILVAQSAEPPVITTRKGLFGLNRVEELDFDNIVAGLKRASVTSEKNVHRVKSRPFAGYPDATALGDNPPPLVVNVAGIARFLVSTLPAADRSYDILTHRSRVILETRLEKVDAIATTGNQDLQRARERALREQTGLIEQMARLREELATVGLTLLDPDGQYSLDRIQELAAQNQVLVDKASQKAPEFALK